MSSNKCQYSLTQPYLYLTYFDFRKHLMPFKLCTCEFCRTVFVLQYVERISIYALLRCSESNM